MPNGFMGSADEWKRMEAPYIRIDPILTAFAARHGLELQKNYRDADRSLRWSDEINRAIWVHFMGKHGPSETYEVSVIAFQDRGDPRSPRYIKSGIVADGVSVDELDRVLERARRILASWTPSDLDPPTPKGARVTPRL